MNTVNWAKGLLMISAFVLFFGSWSYNNYQDYLVKIEEVEEESELKKRGWKTVSASLPVYGKVPNLPDIPSIVYFPSGRPDLSMRLKYIVQNNPDPSVSVVMNDAISSGFLPFTFERGTGAYAKFSYMPRTMIVEDLSSDSREWFPVLVFDPDRLADLKTVDDVLFAMAVTSHEFVHFLQWERSDKEERKLFAPGKARSMTPFQCEHLWASEREAYMLECELINSWGGLIEMNALCKRVTSVEAFSQTLFSLMIDGPTGQRNPQCHHIWAELGGAPDPEFYRMNP